MRQALTIPSSRPPSASAHVKTLGRSGSTANIQHEQVETHCRTVGCTGLGASTLHVHQGRPDNRFHGKSPPRFACWGLPGTYALGLILPHRMSLPQNFARLLILLVTCAFGYGISAQAMEPPTFESDKPRIDQLWAATPLAKEMTEFFGSSALKWVYRVNNGLPFPDPWPPKQDTTLVYYIHAVAMAPHIRDAEVQAEPWARVMLSKNGTKVEPLDVQYKELGTQGVRPLRRDEIEILKYGPEVWKFLSGLNALPSDSDALTVRTRAYYCLSLRNSSLLRNIYASRHVAFVTWLSCNEK
jgi:hypothetical protein